MMHIGDRSISLPFELFDLVFSSLHESVVKLSAHQVKQSLEQRWSPARTTTNKSRITLEEFEHLAMPIYLKTIKKFP